MKKETTNYIIKKNLFLKPCNLIKCFIKKKKLMILYSKAYTYRSFFDGSLELKMCLKGLTGVPRCPIKDHWGSKKFTNGH